MTISYRHQLSPAYEEAADWLNLHASPGNVVMSNTFFLDYFLKDSTFLEVNVTALPPDFNTFQAVKKNVTYLVIFTTQVRPSDWQEDLPYGYQYAFTRSMKTQIGMIMAYQYPERDPIVRIYVNSK